MITSLLVVVEISLIIFKTYRFVIKSPIIIDVMNLTWCQRDIFK